MTTSRGCDHHQRHHQDRRDHHQGRQRRGRRKFWLVVALVVTLLGATGVQASSTVRLGQAHHMVDVALPALVALLEVGSITGASLYVLTEVKGTRVRAGLLIGLVAGLGWWGGQHVYGYLTASVVTGSILLLVDIIGRFWHEAVPSITSAGDDAGEAAGEAGGDAGDAGEAGGDAGEAGGDAGEAGGDVTPAVASLKFEQSEVTPPVTEPAGDPAAAGGDAGEPGGDAGEAAGGAGGEPDTEPLPLADDEPDDDVLPAVPGVAPETVARAAWLLDDEPTLGRPRLTRELGVSDYYAKKLLDALRPIHVVGDEPSPSSRRETARAAEVTA